MSRSRGAGPKPKAGRLLGSGSKGRQGGVIKGSKATPASATTDPSQAGAPDVVARNNAARVQGAMQQKQLKKNKSAGISVSKLKK
jgi:hypothetical protein